MLFMDFRIRGSKAVLYSHLSSKGGFQEGRKPDGTIFIFGLVMTQSVAGNLYKAVV